MSIYSLDLRWGLDKSTLPRDGLAYSEVTAASLSESTPDTTKASVTMGSEFLKKLCEMLESRLISLEDLFLRLQLTMGNPADLDSEDKSSSKGIFFIIFFISF